MPIAALLLVQTHKVGFRKDIDAFLAADKITPPPKNAIVFVGSSIVRLWKDLDKQMAPLPVFNRGFGGSKTWEVDAYADEIVFAYKPQIIVYYCGSNDINANESAPAIAGRIKAFMDRVERWNSSTKLFFVSIIKAPQKQARWGDVDAANREVEAYCKSHQNRFYVDVNPAVFDQDGKARVELYLDDKLHYKPPAYLEFTKILKPRLLAEYKPSSN